MFLKEKSCICCTLGKLGNQSQTLELLLMVHLTADQDTFAHLPYALRTVKLLYHAVCTNHLKGKTYKC